MLALSEPELFSPPPDVRARRVTVAASMVLGPEGLDDDAGVARYLDGGPGEVAGPAAADALAKSLDPDRARRMDRGGALLTAASSRVLRAAGIDPGRDGARTGIVCGIANRALLDSSRGTRNADDKMATPVPTVPIRNFTDEGAQHLL